MPRGGKAPIQATGSSWGPAPCKALPFGTRLPSEPVRTDVPGSKTWKTTLLSGETASTFIDWQAARLGVGELARDGRAGRGHGDRPDVGELLRERGAGGEGSEGEKN